MIDLVFITLFQLAAGEPAMAPGAGAEGAAVTEPVAPTESAPVENTTTPETPPAAQPTPAPVVERQVCRRVPVTGSNMMHRVCRTVRDSEADQQNAQRFLDRSRVPSGNGSMNN